MDVINLKAKQSLPLAAVWRDWGFRINEKMVLYLENLCLNENPASVIPEPDHQAPEHYRNFKKRQH